jgi:hypothetical protein
LDKSLDISRVDVLGELGEGTHDSLVGSDLVELDGVLGEFAGDGGDLGEGASGGEGGADIDGVIDSVDGVVEGNGGLVELDGFQSSDFVDDVQVLSVLDQAILGGGEGGLGFSLLEGAGSQLRLGGLEGTSGVLDFLLSESELSDAFDLLSLIDVVVLDLFLIDGGLESIQNTLHGVEGGSDLELVLNLQHDGHDVSSVRELQGELGGVEGLGRN